MPVGLFAGAHSALVDRLVLFAPIACRGPRRYETPSSFPAWRIVTPQDQWNRFIEDVPAHEPAVLSRIHFEEWSQFYLDSDPDSRSRDPAGVKTPLGPFSEIIKAWHGRLGHPFDPSRNHAPGALAGKHQLPARQRYRTDPELKQTGREDHVFSDFRSSPE
jgi:hypothetical protein